MNIKPYLTTQHGALCDQDCIESEFKEAMTFPIVLIAIEHDGPGEVLGKQKLKR